MSVEQGLIKAKSLVKEGRDGKARKCYLRVPAKFPGNRTALAARKRIGGAGKSHAEQKAAAELNDAVAKFRGGRLDEALSEVAAVEARLRDLPQVLNLKGVVLSRMHRPADGTETWRRCLALRPNQPEVLVILAKSQINDGRNDEEIASCRAAVALLPSNRALRLRLAKGLRTIGRKTRAIRVLEDALHRDDVAFRHDMLPGRIPTCVLEFHRREPAVRTTSVDQERCEIYTTSSQEWRNCEPSMSVAFARLPPVP